MRKYEIDGRSAFLANQERKYIVGNNTHWSAFLKYTKNRDYTVTTVSTFDIFYLRYTENIEFELLDIESIT